MKPCFKVIMHYLKERSREQSDTDMCTSITCNRDKHKQNCMTQSMTLSCLLMIPGYIVPPLGCSSPLCCAPVLLQSPALLVYIDPKLYLPGDRSTLSPRASIPAIFPNADPCV